MCAAQVSRIRNDYEESAVRNRAGSVALYGEASIENVWP